MYNYFTLKRQHYHSSPHFFLSLYVMVTLNTRQERKKGLTEERVFFEKERNCSCFCVSEADQEKSSRLRLGREKLHEWSYSWLCVSHNHIVSSEWLRKRMALPFSDSSFGTYKSLLHQVEKITSLISQPSVPFWILVSR